MPSDRVAFAGEIVAVVVARSAAEARDAAENSSTSSTTSCRPRSTSRTPPPTPSSHPTSAPTSRRCGSSTRRGRHRRRRGRAISKARGDGIVIEREYRQQRLIPAFMEPRSVVVDPTGEQYVMYSATQIPHILRFALAATTGVPESKIASSPPTSAAASAASSR